MKDYLEFWNSDDINVLKEKISNPKRWCEDTWNYLKWLFPQGIPEIQVGLEIGCGIGRLMKPLSAKFNMLYGLDISDSMIREGRKYMEGIDNVKTFLLSESDRYAWPIEDKSIDFVYSAIAFQHIPEKALISKHVEEMHRTLKPGGKFRIQTHVGEPSGGFHGFHGHYFRSLKEFEALFVNFKILSSEEGTGHKDWLWVTGEKLLLDKDFEEGS